MLLASCGFDAKFHEWPSGKYFGHYECEERNKIRTASWSKDGDKIVTVPSVGCGYGTSVVLCITPCFKCLGKINVSRVEAATFSRVQNTEITLGLDNGSIMIYDVNEKNVIKVLKAIPASVEFLDYSLDDDYLAAGCSNGQIVLYNKNKSICASFCVPNSYDLSAISCHPTVKEYLAGASFTGHLAVWDVSTGNTILGMKSHDAGIMDIAFSGIKDIVSTVGLDKKFCLYSLNSGECTKTTLDNQLSSIAFVPNSDQIVVSSIDGKILGYDLRNMNIPYRTLIPHTSIYKIKFQPQPPYTPEKTTVEEINVSNNSSTINTSVKENKSFDSISEDENIVQLEQSIAGGGDMIKELITELSKTEIEVPKDIKGTEEECLEDEIRLQVANSSKIAEEYNKFSNVIKSVINSCADSLVTSMNNEFLKLKIQLTKDITNLENRLNEKFKEIVYVTESGSFLSEQELKRYRKDC